MKDRQLGASVFHCQTVDAIISGALFDISRYGRVRTEEEIKNIRELCRDFEYVQSLYEKYFSQKMRGEFCAVPL